MFVPPPGGPPPFPVGGGSYERILDLERTRIFDEAVGHFEWSHSGDPFHTQIRTLICHPSMPPILAQQMIEWFQVCEVRRDGVVAQLAEFLDWIALNQPGNLQLFGSVRELRDAVNLRWSPAVRGLLDRVRELIRPEGDVVREEWSKVEFSFLRMSLPESFSRWFDPAPILDRLDEVARRGEVIEANEIHQLMYAHPQPTPLAVRHEWVEGVEGAELCRLLRVTGPTWTCCVDTPLVTREAIGHYLGARRNPGAPGQLATLVAPRGIGDLFDWRLEGIARAHNCMSFDVGFGVSERGLIPGAPHLPLDDPRRRGPPLEELLNATTHSAWRIDHHLRDQGCIPLAALAISQSPEFIFRPDREHPYHLISVIAGTDDAHVMRCFYHERLGQLLWMECLKGQARIRCVHERGIEDGPLITGIPDPSVFTRVGGWPYPVGYYLIPTHHVTFFNEHGEEADFVPLRARIRAQARR